MREELAHQELSKLEIGDFIDRVKGARYRNRRCLEVFFDRCQEESIRDPQAALPLVFEAPEYVDRCRKWLGNDHPKYQVRACGVLATGLTLLGSYKMAERAFEWGRSVGCRDEYELAALDCRHALFEAYRQNWEPGLRLAERAVKTFSTDTGTARDDRSLSTALSFRAIIRFNAYRAGIDMDLETAAADYQRCLAEAAPRLRRTRLSAVVGLGAIAVSIWFSGKPTRVTPISVVNSLSGFRNELRRQDIPIESVVDSKTRWALGLAIRQLVGGLSPVAEAHLRDALAVLGRLGSPRDVAELALDLQWCLVTEGRWAKALEDWKTLEDLIDEVPATWRVALMLWGEGLKQRVLTEEVTRQVFWEVRGIRDALIPSDQTSPALDGGVQDDELLGW